MKLLMFRSISSICLLYLLLSCSSREVVFEGEFVRKELKPIGLHLTLDAQSPGEMLNFASNSSYKGRSVYAIFNSNLHSIDVYDLENLAMMERITFERDGPFGISRPEAILSYENKWLVFSGVGREWLEVDNNGVKKEKVRVPKNTNRKKDFSLQVTAEFGCVPVVLDGLLIVPIAPNLDFESKKYYAESTLGAFDIETGEMISNFSGWPNQYQKNEYFGTLAEFSLESSPRGVFQSFPIQSEIWEIDINGKKQSTIYLASPDFPRKIEGLTRHDNDLQEESNLIITSPTHLRTIYNPNTNHLFRLEKQEQALKDVEGKLNTTLYGPWRLVWVDLMKPETINYFDLPYPAFFIPNAFPYKNGIAIKLLEDRDEDSLSFVYYNTKD